MNTLSEKQRSSLEKDLPEFSLNSILGSGSSSTVYRATQKTLGRDVAIKRFSPEAFLSESSFLKRFEREAAMWAHFNHENLIHLYDYRSTPNARYIILEFCHGIELRSLMDQTTHLPSQIVTCLAHQILSALEYIHRFRIVHRDIKPANLFVTSEGVVKLMDFGISLCPELESLTIPGNIVGTPAYMSPEQALGKECQSTSDLFSFGVLLFEMLEGFRPFRSITFESLLEEMMEGKHIRLSYKHPQTLRKLIHSCLKSSPHRRPSSATQMKEKIETLLRKMKIQTPRTEVQHFLTEQGIACEEFHLFPEGVVEKTTKSPLAKTFAEVSSNKKRKKSPRPSKFLTLFLSLLLILAIFLILFFFSSFKENLLQIISVFKNLLNLH